MAPRPGRRRRKAARPAEIIEAAFGVFMEKSYAAAKLDEVAARAGVAKGTVYLYFPGKAELFRAVAQSAAAPNLRAIQGMVAAEGSIFELAPRLLAQAAALIADSRAPALAMMVLAESRAFPDLARVWHDEVVAKVLDALSGLIARGQARGEVLGGDPRPHALSIVGPMLTGVLLQQVFGAVAPAWPDRRDWRSGAV